MKGFFVYPWEFVLHLCALTQTSPLVFHLYIVFTLFLPVYPLLSPLLTRQGAMKKKKKVLAGGISCIC